MTDVAVTVALPGALREGRFEIAGIEEDGSEAVRAAAEGDGTAWEALYVRHSPMVHAILVSRVPRGEADDLVQDVFLDAMRGLAGLRDPRTFPGWLATIARRRAFDFHRRDRRGSELPDDLRARGAASGPSEGEEILRVLRALPVAYAETLAMRLVAGMTGPEIAERTGMTHGSVRVNLHRGIALLRKRLEDGGRHA